jgi:hypothetical protein
LLLAFEKISVQRSQGLVNDSCPHEMTIKQAAHTRMFHSREAVLEQQRGHRIEAGVVEAVDAGIPMTSLGHQVGFCKGFPSPIHLISYERITFLAHTSMPSLITLA